MDMNEFMDFEEIEAHTLSQVENMVCEIFELKKEQKELEKKAVNISGRRQALEVQVQAVLEEAGLDSFKSKAGYFTINEKESFKTPKTNVDKQRFFNWLKSQKGEEFMWEHVTINSNKLNSFLNEERRELEDKAQFDVPGIEDPHAFKRISLTKSKPK